MKTDWDLIYTKFIARKIRTARLKLNMSIESLAHNTKMKADYLGKIERAQACPSSVYLLRILWVLEVDFSTFFLDFPPPLKRDNDGHLYIV